jgi:hypothetical protein
LTGEWQLAKIDLNHKGDTMVRKFFFIASLAFSSFAQAETVAQLQSIIPDGSLIEISDASSGSYQVKWAVENAYNAATADLIKFYNRIILINGLCVGDTLVTANGHFWCEKKSGSLN